MMRLGNHLYGCAARVNICPRIPIQRQSYSQNCYTMANDISQRREDVYVPEVDLEDFESYAVGGYHPIMIGDTFKNGQYKVLHKLGFGSYSTIWLGRDTKSDRSVALKVLLACESTKNNEVNILRQLQSLNKKQQPGQQFMPRLLDTFSIDGPNGQHTCLVHEASGCSIAASKEDSINFMFPLETARSITAQIIMGVTYLHSRGICHGDLHLRNILLRDSNIRSINLDLLYDAYRLDKVPITRLDGAPVEPHAPPYAVYPMHMKTAADKLTDPVITISDYGTSFNIDSEQSPELHTPPLYLPPEDFFGEPITLAVDIWTMGITLYEVLGERPLFESFNGDPDDILADTVSTLGPLPTRWWDKWPNRQEFFESDGSWTHNIQRIYTPVFRPLHQRMWDMGRGSTKETCELDVAGGELRALEEMLKGMLAYEPSKRLTAQQLIKSEYMVKWALPAWERQLERTKNPKP